MGHYQEERLSQKLHRNQPKGVNRADFESRSNNLAPNSASNFKICCDSEG